MHDMHFHRLLYSELRSWALSVVNCTSSSPAAEPDEAAFNFLGKNVREMVPVESTAHVLRVRYMKELDSFELTLPQGNVISRKDMRALLAQVLFSLDEAEQLAFTCEQCFAEQGWHEERGFRRCNKCGYPGQ